MTHSEYNDRIGYKATEKEFNEANAIYMTMSDQYDKDDFCEDYKQHKDSILLEDFYNQTSFFKKRASEQKKRIEELESQLQELGKFLAKQGNEWDQEELSDKAVEILGEKEYIRTLIQQDCDFSSNDKDIIMTLLH